MKIIIYIIAGMGAYIALFLFFTSCVSEQQSSPNYEKCFVDKHGIIICPTIEEKNN